LIKNNISFYPQENTPVSNSPNRIDSSSKKSANLIKQIRAIHPKFNYEVDGANNYPNSFILGCMTAESDTADEVQEDRTSIVVQMFEKENNKFDPADVELFTLLMQLMTKPVLA